jgi:zinc D-Ala-D-Ala carboxypeptidase
MTLITWTRGKNLPISQHFNSKEFTCSCGVCSMQKVERELIKRLEEVRAIYGKPIKVTSGFRCERYQEALRAQGLQTAVGKSTHSEGRAADITGDDLVALELACTKMFKAIGVAKTFLHVDLRDDKVRRWTYA